MVWSKMSKLKETALHLENISKTYISGNIHVKALNDLNFEIANGERICILDPSGSGLGLYYSIQIAIPTMDLYFTQTNLDPSNHPLIPS